MRTVLMAGCSLGKSIGLDECLGSALEALQYELSGERRGGVKLVEESVDHAHNIDIFVGTA
jgi:hypothetical protein